MRNLLSDKKVQLGLGAVVVAVVVWLFVAGGNGDKVEEATTNAETPAEVVAPDKVDAAIEAFETTPNATNDNETNTNSTENTTNDGIENTTK